MSIFMQPCVHVCACTGARTYVYSICKCVRVTTHVKMHIRICVYMYIRMCTCSCACVRVCTHVYDYALCLGQLHYATTCVFERYVCNSQALVYTMQCTYEMVVQARHRSMVIHNDLVRRMSILRHACTMDVLVLNLLANCISISLNNCLCTVTSRLNLELNIY